MLAQAVISKYNRIEDFRCACDYLAYMFGETPGFFTRNLLRDNGSTNIERFVRNDSMMCRKWDGVEDCYISMNAFLSPRKADTPSSGRKVNNLKRLNALYVDIDCYGAGMEQDEVVYILHESYFDRVIPYPTFIVNSGRGLYLVYKIDEDRNALPRWQAVENYLVAQLADLGADSKASDAARILRVPGTVNSKNGKTVSILSFENIQYTLHDIMREYGIQPVKPREAHKRRLRPDGLPGYAFGEATERQRRTARWLATELQIDLPNFDSFNETAEYINRNLPAVVDRKTGKTEPGKPLNLAAHTSIKTILAGRRDELCRLFAQRKGEDCCREYALFLHRLWGLELYGDPERALRETLEFNERLDAPFTDDYVRKTTASAERKYRNRSTYRYSTKKIIRELRITAEEQTGLEYLCGCPDCAKERKKRANRKGYLSRLDAAGKKTAKTAIEERRQAIAAMLAEGKGKAAICHALNLSSRTFDRDKAAIKAEGLVEKIKTAMVHAANAVVNAVQEVAETAVSAVSGTVPLRSPFFQPPYYKNVQAMLVPLIDEQDYPDSRGSPAGLSLLGQPRAP